MPDTYDIAIIGAGPAGATLARLLAGRYRVLLVDSRDPSIPSNPKACGGLLAPDAQRALAALGLGLPLEVLVEPQLFVVRATDLESCRTRYYQRHYINIDRGVFDAWLLSLVPSSGDIWTGTTFRSAQRSGGLWRLGLRRGAHEEEIEARVIIGADGAASAVRRRLFPKATRPRRYVAIQERFVAYDPQPHFSAHFDPRLTDFYGWTIPKSDQIIVGLALPEGSGALERFEQFKKAISTDGFDPSSPLSREGALILRPGPRSPPLLGSGGAALIGEAAGLISPSSAEGISYAFDSAIALADALFGGIEGFERRYLRAASSLILKVMLKAAKAPVIFHPWLRSAVMRAGFSSVGVRGASSSVGEPCSSSRPDEPCASPSPDEP